MAKRKNKPKSNIETNNKNEQNKNNKDENKEKKNIKKEKSLKKSKTENIKTVKKSKEKERREKLNEIYNIKYLGCGYSDDGIEDGFVAFNNNGQKVGKENVGMYYGFKIDVDDGKIVNWPEKNLYLKLFIKVVDTGSDAFYDKENNIIYEAWGYVHDFLGINSPSYGDYINFDTDIHGYIKDWKEKNFYQKIIDYLKEQCIPNNYYE